MVKRAARVLLDLEERKVPQVILVLQELLVVQVILECKDLLELLDLLAMTTRPLHMIFG